MKSTKIGEFTIIFSISIWLSYHVLMLMKLYGKNLQGIPCVLKPEFDEIFVTSLQLRCLNRMTHLNCFDVFTYDLHFDFGSSHANC